MSAATTTLSNAPTQSRAKTARFVMLGGFLGAGKTTLAARLGVHLRDAGQRVAFITNDQGSDVLDTRILRSHGFPTEQITGGSLGRQFDSFAAAGARLIESAEPDVFIVEPVGSCSDLIATVNNPLGRLHKNSYRLAPFSVVVDPILAARVLGIEKGAVFSEAIQYIYRKQLEEAELIVVNKTDATSASALKSLRERLAREFPNSRRFELSARTGSGLEPWSEVLMNTSPAIRRFEIDREKTASAEALLSSLNCSVQLSALKGFECNPVMSELARAIQRKMRSTGIPIAHLKMTISAEVDVAGVATLNLIGNDLEPEVGRELAEPVERGAMHLSIRAECKPDLLHAVVTDAMTHLCAVFPGLFARLNTMEHFRPSAIGPTHRMTS